MRIYRNTPGARIGQGYHPGAIPKRHGLWEHSGRVKPHRKDREPSERVFPDPLKNFAISLDICQNSFTKVVRTAA